MRRTLAEFFLLIATATVMFLLFGLFTVVFSIPNRAGPNYASLAALGSSALRLAINHKLAVFLAALFTCLAVTVLWKAGIHRRHRAGNLAAGPRPVQPVIAMGKPAATSRRVS